jgi:hypothetical protein
MRRHFAKHPLFPRARCFPWLPENWFRHHRGRCQFDMNVTFLCYGIDIPTSKQQQERTAARIRPACPKPAVQIIGV